MASQSRGESTWLTRRACRDATRRACRDANRPCNCARTPSWGSDRSSSYPTGSCWLVGLSGGCFPAFRQRFIRGTRSALCSWLLTHLPTPICICKPFSCKVCPRIREWHPTGTMAIFDPVFAPKVESGGFYCIRDRKSKTGVLRSSGSKNEDHSAPKVEDGAVSVFFRTGRSKMGDSSKRKFFEYEDSSNRGFLRSFGSEERRTPPSTIFRLRRSQNPAILHLYGRKNHVADGGRYSTG